MSATSETFHVEGDRRSSEPSPIPWQSISAAIALGGVLGGGEMAEPFVLAELLEVGVSPATAPDQATHEGQDATPHEDEEELQTHTRLDGFPEWESTWGSDALGGRG